MEALFFWIFAVMTIAMAGVVITYRQAIACALALAAALFGIAALFVTLEAFFLAITQIIIYAGAVMVLFVFIIMLLDVEKEEEKRKLPWKRMAGIGILILLFAIFFGGVLSSLLQGHTSLAWESKATSENTRQVGKLLFTAYLLPFLMTGVLLLLATIGVVLLNRKDAAK